ncbi:MAG: hypothetical protein K6E98_09140 [Lachnospiraceae bacterium]|nr:hypothetical protein [Lachnospiraceae bacterium]
MRNKKTASILSIILIFSAISNSIFLIHANAGNRLTVTEGSGQAPDIEVIRTDSDGNEIRDDKDLKSTDKTRTNNLINKDSIVTSKNQTYENDLSGIITDRDVTEKKNIYISTPEDLIKLAKNCSLDTFSRDKNVILKNDLDLSDSNFKYIPIFSGTFDGCGYTISGINLSEAESYTGLFCITQESAVIKDLTVKGNLMADGDQLAIGGIAGDNYGLISNCQFDGTINGYDYIGGIAGYNENSGSISNCTSNGMIIGRHFTGGITGYNLGNINGCTNKSDINITSLDETVSFKDIDINKYKNDLLNLFGDNNKQRSTDIINSSVDIGGICGYSQGTIISCTNNATVGYKHFGYNIGGIAGRQNGYIEMCINQGNIYGRKDVGGIVGQAEPYVIIDITEDIIGQLTSNMNTLHDLINVTLNDAGNESDLVSSRLNMVKNFTDKALDDTSCLSVETEDFINGVMDGGNEFFNRIDHALNVISVDGGILDQTTAALDNSYTAVSNLVQAVKDLDIYNYMSDDEKNDYDQAKTNIEKAHTDYKNYYDNYYSSDYNYNYYRYINTHQNNVSYYATSSNLIPVDVSGNEINWPDVLSDNKEEYNNIAKLIHKDTTTEPATITDFPSSQEPYSEIDSKLNTDASTEALSKVLVLTDNEFRNNYGISYTSYIENNIDVMASILLSHEQEMSENTRKDIKYAISYTKQSVYGFEDTVGNIKSTVSQLGSKGTITFPKLSKEYQDRSNSLIANLQGMSDNLGYLNNEMNSSNQKLVDDMVEVNDQFNVIMLLIADAIDGVLEADYTDVYEDNSLAVAQDCTDAAIVYSINYGSVSGDIDTGGICGTMAIEYDFDLESDVTGIEDAATGSTYRTKCVLRYNKNNGTVTGMKNYVGGMCGLQEMGTILRCQNYGKLTSESGDYIGGISGKSLSTIVNCYTKGILSGDNNIGGICGMGYDISMCYSLPTINATGSNSGAIAGDNSTNGQLDSNYFVSNDYAGINRVSYSHKAEPLTYNELLQLTDLPAEFKKIKVNFILDDEIITIKEYNYGDSIDEFPNDRSGNDYVIWDTDDKNTKALFSDMELYGKTSRFITTLGSSQLRENGQSAVLVDGQFTSDKDFKAVLTGDNKDPDIFEVWELSIHDDSSNQHLVRYCPPPNVTDVKIWIPDKDSGYEAQITKMGQYLTFNTSGRNITFMVENTYENPLMKYAPYIICVTILLICIIIFVIHKKNKNKRESKNFKHTGNHKDNKNKTDSYENNIIDLDHENI